MKPPEGYTNWLDYAIATMDTRTLFVQESFRDEPWWEEVVSREDMREAARKELTELRERAGDSCAG